MMPLARIDRASSSSRPSSIVRARLELVRAQQIDVDVERRARRSADAARRVGNERAQAAAEGGRFSTMVWLRLAGGGAASRARNSRREREVGFGAARLRRRRVIAGMPWLGASPSRMLRGMTVSKTRSWKNSRMSLRDLLPEVGALVVHRQQHAGDVERGLSAAAHAAQRGDEIGEPFEREVLAVERNQHGVGGDERVEREQAERRRRVDEDVVEAVAQRRRASARRRRSRFGQRDELDFGAGEIAVGGDQREVRRSRVSRTNAARRRRVRR